MKKISLVISTFLIAGMTINAQIITTVAGNYSLGQGYNGDGIAATAAELNYPGQEVIDAAGNIYIADGINYVVRKVNTSGIITTVAGIPGVSGYSGDGGQATAAELAYTAGVALDASGDLYICDGGNSIVRMVNTSGIITTVVGTQGNCGAGPYGGPATAALMCNPFSITFDAAGNYYVADWNNSNVVMVNTSGIITNFAGTPASQGYSGDGGAATACQLYGPAQVAVDGSGNVYIADRINNEVRIVNTSGIISSYAGNGYDATNGYCQGGYTGDGGPATAAELDEPQGVAVDAAGNVYFSDGCNNVIRMVNTSGIISTYAGMTYHASGQYSGDGGQATAAELNQPFSVALDASGALYIDDYGNNVVRKVANCPMSVTDSIVQNVLCNGGSTGSAKAIMTNGTAPFTYSWSNGTSTVSVSNPTGPVLSAGTYTVTVEDVNGCRASAPVTIMQPSPLTVGGGTIYQDVTVTANGNSNFNITTTYPNELILIAADGTNTGPGTLSTTAGTVTVNGNNATYINGTYRTVTNTVWAYAATTPGSYSIAINENGLTSPWYNNMATALYEPNQALTVANIANNDTNSNLRNYMLSGNITVANNNSYLWGNVAYENGSGYNSQVFNSNAAFSNGIPNLSETHVGICCYLSVDVALGGSDVSAGTYSIFSNSLFDFQGAAAMTLVAINATAGPAFTINSQSLCGNNGSVTANVNGGNMPYTYSWTGGNTNETATGLSAGSYTVNVTDNGGCTTSASISITGPAALSIVHDSIAQVGPCNGMAGVTVSGGTSPYTYLWTTGGQTNDTIQSQCAGTYCCVITDNNGCSTSACVTVTLETGTNALNNSSQLDVYPNPSTGQFLVTGLEKGMIIEMYDYTGRKISSLTAADASVELNLSGHESGVYLLRILNEDGVLVNQMKIVKSE